MLAAQNVLQDAAAARGLCCVGCGESAGKVLNVLFYKCTCMHEQKNTAAHACKGTGECGEYICARLSFAQTF